MTDNPSLTFPGFFSSTLERFPHRNALAIAGEKPLTWSQVDDRIRSLVAYLEGAGISNGDKVAILSSNQPNWAIAYFAITFMGAIAVPLLPEFLPEEIETLVTHAEVKCMFVSENLVYKVEQLKTSWLKTVVRIEDFSEFQSDTKVAAYDPDRRFQGSFNIEEDDLAAIIYTSGTTGNPKGVMLSHRNICFTAIKGFEIQHIAETDRFLSVLPLSHTYENTLGLILPMYSGACVYYLNKAPVPAVLLPALKEVKPTTILTVPLIIEKIYNSKILPSFTEKPLMKMLYNIPVFRRLLNRVAGKKLMDTFGGELRFFGIGGAKLSRRTEEFLIEARFPYAVGYGLTESSPLLAGFNPQNAVLQTTGPACKGVELRINQPDASTGEGEIWARGPNIMQGYYKEPGMTREIITRDGWLRTGDLGSFDKHGNLSIKGRVKNMIVRSNGENIYPEDIESIINSFRHVVESLVVEKKGRLVALVHFNREEIDLRYRHLKDEVTNHVEEKIEELRNELHDYINSRVNRVNKVQMVVAQPGPFQKTATQKIKRFLYT